MSKRAIDKILSEADTQRAKLVLTSEDGDAILEELSKISELNLRAVRGIRRQSSQTATPATYDKPRTRGLTITIEAITAARKTFDAAEYADTESSGPDIATLITANMNPNTYKLNAGGITTHKACYDCGSTQHNKGDKRCSHYDPNYCNRKRGRTTKTQNDRNPREEGDDALWSMFTVDNTAIRSSNIDPIEDSEAMRTVGGILEVSQLCKLTGFPLQLSLLGQLILDGTGLG